MKGKGGGRCVEKKEQARERNEKGRCLFLEYALYNRVSLEYF